jgi:orotidine-5'-phosphate decarboxylase
MKTDSRASGPGRRVCLALDFSDRAEILAAAGRFGPRVEWLKIGLEAFISEGPGLVAEVARHARVFLDLKLHDIPTTVARAVVAAGRSGASMINVHASGGRAMLRAAREALPGPDAPLLVAVTLLTSIDAAALADLPMAGHPEGIARRLAVLARECGLNGVVCSPTDLPAIRSSCGPDFLTVVPGIRPAGAPPGDQRRHAIPSAALAAGADILVVGRPVTAAEDPDAALDGLLAEIESARREETLKP